MKLWTIEFTDYDAHGLEGIFTSEDAVNAGWERLMVLLEKHGRSKRDSCKYHIETYESDTLAWETK